MPQSRARSEPVRAIFFDFDGVLIDTEPLHFECWAEVLRPRGVSLPWKVYTAEMAGFSNRRMVADLCRRAGKRYSRRFFDDCYAQKRALYQERALQRCRIPSDLVAFIRAASKAYKLGVVSSSSRSEVEPFLKAQGIPQHLAALVCEEDVENFKPAPDPYRRALAMVNRGSRKRIRPLECLVVEDSEPGAEAGRRAGMRVVRVLGPVEVVGAVSRVIGNRRGFRACTVG